MSRSKLPSLKELAVDDTDAQIHRAASAKTRKKKTDCGMNVQVGMTKG